MDDIAWYIARVEPGREHLAEYFLNRRGFLTYLPMQVVFRRTNSHTKGKVERSVALMVGYCFVAMPDSGDWFRLNTTSHVIGIIGDYRGYYRLRGDVVPKLMARFGQVVAARKVERWMKSRKEFEAGDMVTINAGPLRNAYATFKVEKITGSAATILMHLFGGVTQVKVPLDFLEAA